MKRILTCLTLGICVASYATVINVPGTQSTIQAGLNAASAGDTVLVATGTYNENITWPSINGITLLAAGDSTNTFIDGGGSNRVITFSSGAIDTNSVVKGFTLRNGETTAWPTGAGAYISNGASPLFVNCHLDNNRGLGNRSYGAGVAITSTGSKGYFRNCRISRSYGKPSGGSYNYGGGFYVNNGAQLHLVNSHVSGNHLDTCSRTYGGGVYVTGGQVYCTDVWFDGNRNTSTGWNHGPAINMQTGSTVTLNRVYIQNSVMDDGGSWYYGFGIYNSGGTLNATNVLISDNAAGVGGNWYYGGGIYQSSSATTNLMHVTIANNTRTGGTITGGAIYLNTGGGTVTATNNILWNTNGATEINGSGATVTYSCVRNGFAGTGNITSNPQFVSASDYHPQATSPVEGAGTTAGMPNEDIEKKWRPFAPTSTTPDMGAYEAGLPTDVMSDNFQSVVAFPNPSRGAITFSGKQILEVRLYTLEGKNVAVLNGTGSRLQVNFNDMDKGVYLAKVNNAGTYSTHRIVLIE